MVGITVIRSIALTPPPLTAATHYLGLKLTVVYKQKHVAAHRKPDYFGLYNQSQKSHQQRSIKIRLFNSNKVHQFKELTEDFICITGFHGY